MKGLTGVVNVSCSAGINHSTGCVDARGLGYFWGSNKTNNLGHLGNNEVFDTP